MLTKRHAALFGGAIFILSAFAACLFFMHGVSGHEVVAAISDRHGISMATAGLAGLRASRLDLVSQMKAILDKSEAEDRDLTEDEQKAFDGLQADKDGLDRRIARLEGMEASTALLDATIPAASRRAAIDRPGGDPAIREFESFGQFMHSVRFNPSDQRLNYVENASADQNRAELRMDDGASGGFMIPPQFRNTLLTLTPQQAIIRPRATVIEAGSPPDAPVTMPALDQSGAAPANMFGGVEVQWIGEGATKPDTDLKLREITLTPHEVAGVITVTDKLLRNWGAASSLLETQLRGAVSQAEDFAFLNGNGVGKPLGILKAGATLKVNRAVANQIAYNDVAEMVARGYGNGTFVYSRSALAYLLKLKDADGRPLWVPSMREGEPATLLGRPAIASDRNPQLGSLGDLWYGDLSQYLVKDGSGPFVAASEHVLFKQNKTVIKIFWNVDGAPWLTAPFQLENGYLVSPFVALDVPGV